MLTSLASAAVSPSAPPMCLDFVGDTGAGETLGSVQALRRQGFEVPDEVVTATSQPVQFLTGGGAKAGTSTVGFWTQEFDRLHNMYLLPNCPLALSIGQLCHEGYTFLWSGDTLPMLIPPTARFDYEVEGPVTPAIRVDHHVPIFRLTVACTHGLPATSSSSHDVPVGGGHAAFGLGDPSGDKGRHNVDSEVLPMHPGGDGDSMVFGPAPGAGEARGDPDPQEIIDKEEEEVLETSKHHLMTHLPKSRTCDTCKKAKLYSAPHRREINMNSRIKEAKRVEAPERYLEKISIDHIIVGHDVGFRGETCSVVLVDHFTGLISLVPCKSKEADEVEAALRRLCGKWKPGVIQVASDRAPEIRRAVREMGFSSEPSPPYESIHNTKAESAIRTVTGMSSSILLHAGLNPDYWPLALTYLEWAYNVTTLPPGIEDKDEWRPSKYEMAMGYPVDFYMVPFGALVWYKVPSHHTFGPKGEPALFLGVELADGLLFKGCYRVWPLDTFKEGVFKEFVTRSLAIPEGDWKFPALEKEEVQRALQEEAPAIFQLESGLSPPYGR